jgi:hypothetical protein
VTRMTAIWLSAGVSAIALVVAARAVGRSEPAPPSAFQSIATLAPHDSKGPGTDLAPPRKTGFESLVYVDEGSLMTQLRSVEESDSVLALELAREGNRRFPESSAAAERAAIIVKSLAREGKLSEARGEAEVMVNRYAGTSWAALVEQHTGAHPHTDRYAP